MRKNIVLLSCLPVTPLLWSLTLDWLFDVMRCLSRTLDSSHALLLELQRVKDTVSSVAIAADVTGHCRKTTDANLDCVFVVEITSIVVPKIVRAFLAYLFMVSTKKFEATIVASANGAFINNVGCAKISGFLTPGFQGIQRFECFFCTLF